MYHCLLSDQIIILIGYVCKCRNSFSVHYSAVVNKTVIFVIYYYRIVDINKKS